MTTLLRREEFAKMCHVPVSSIAIGVRRGNIIDKKGKDGRKYIDLTNPINRDFFTNATENFNRKRTVIISEDGKVLGKGAPLKKKTAPKKKVGRPKKEDQQEDERLKFRKETIRLDESFEGADGEFQTETSILEWAERKKKADALLQEAKAEKEQLAVQKLAGQLLPLELLNSIMQQNNRSIFSTFQNDLDNFASIYCDILANGDRKRLSEISNKLALKLEDTISRAKDVTLSSIENAISEYQETRNRGEKK